MSARAPVVAILLAALAGCQLGVVVSPPVDCKSDGACLPGDICVLGACVPAARELVLDLAFTPPNDSGFPKQQVAGVLVPGRSGTVPDQTLRPAVIFAGRVLMDTPAGPVGVPARVEVTRPGEIAGTLLRASATTFTEGALPTFRLSLAPGEYQVTVFPENPAWPPVRRDTPLAITANLQMDLVLPSPGLYRRVTGRVVRGSPARTGVGGATVQGVSADGTPVSTLARTAEDGSFTVVFPPGSGVYKLRVSRSQDGPAIPIVERSDVVVDAALVHVAEIDLGTWERPVPFTGVVKGLTKEGSETAVAGAVVALTGQVGNGRWIEQVMTGPGGDFHVDMPPGSYAVEIRTGAESEHALKRDTLVLPSTPRREWTLDRKPRLWGRVMDPDGAPVSGIFVEAVARPDGVRYIKGVDSDASGIYSLLLDPGRYDIRFIPTGRPLARGELVNLDMPASDVRHDQRLPQGAAVTGLVRDASGRPFPGVTVEVYQPAGSAGGAAKLAGSGITDDSGRYRVVLPAW